MNYGDIWLILTGLALLVAAYVYRAKNVGSYKPGAVFFDDPVNVLDFFVWILFIAILGCTLGSVFGNILIVALKSIMWFYTFLNSL